MKRLLALAILAFLAPAPSIADTTVSSGLTVVVPAQGSKNWGTTFLNSFATPISGHDHTGGGKGVQISTNAIATNAVTGAKIRLANDEYLKGRNAANSADINVIKVNGSNTLTLGTTLASPTISSPTFSGTVTLGTPLPVAGGGTGLSTTPSNGKLLIGNGTDYSLANITGTANQVTVTNGSGAITLSTPQSINTGATPTFAGMTLSGTLDLGSALLKVQTITNGTTDGSDTQAIQIGGLSTTRGAYGLFYGNEAGGNIQLHGGDAVDGNIQLVTNNSTSVIHLNTNTSKGYQVGGAGDLLPETDNAYDIGSGSAQVKNVYAKSAVFTGAGPVITVNSSVTAAGSDSAGATALTKSYNRITGGSVNQGVRLPVPVAGQIVYVKNGSGSTKTVYPHTGGTYNGGSVDAGTTIANSGFTIFIAVTTGDWESS
jgi:hypothetical protein